jgi:hypothetical protein
MVTAEQLIREYCNRQHIQLLKVSGCDQFITANEILYLTDVYNPVYRKMAKMDLRYCTKVNRVVVIRLNVDVSCDERLMQAGKELTIVHFEKNNPLTDLKKKYLREYFDFMEETFHRKPSSEFVKRNPMPRIIGKVKQSKNKIFFSELTTQLIPIINELEVHNIDIELEISKLALRNNQYVWNWIELK